MQEQTQQSTEQLTISKADLQQAITDGVKTVVKELKLDQPGQHFNPAGDESIYKDPAYTMHSLLCAIKKNDRTKINEVYEKAASPMTEGTAADGGYLVPAVTQATILELIPTFGQSRQFMSKIPMGKASTLNIPKEANLPVVNWVNENASISDAKPTLGQITLTAKKAAGIVVLSNELLEDANVQIGQYILRKFAQKFGTAEDVQFFNGTGSPFNGVFKSSNTFGNTVTMSGQITTLDYKDLLDCVYGVDASYLSGAAWYMHRTVLSQIRNISDSQNRPIFVPAGEGTPATLLGYPVRLIENAPSGSSAAGSVVAILGNLENSYIGTKSELSVKILEEASIGGTSLAENDLSAIRVIERVAFDPGLTTSYSAIKLAAS
jgi:HK97 family phage major capsid protein